MAGARAWHPDWRWPLTCMWSWSFNHSQIRRRSLGRLMTLPTPSSAVNKTVLKVVGRILGPRTSRVESSEGTGQWEAIMENQSASFTIRLYVVRVTVLIALHTPRPVTVPCAAEFSLAGNVSAVVEELGGDPEPSSGAGSSAAAELDAAGC